MATNDSFRPPNETPGGARAKATPGPSSTTRPPPTTTASYEVNAEPAPEVNAEPAPEPGPEHGPLDRAARLREADEIVQRNVYWAMGAGVLPLPIFDLFAITGVQLKLIHRLSALYGASFREDLAKKAVTSLLAGFGGVGLGGLIGASLAKLVPVVGQSLGIVSIPVVSGLLTHAVGKTFIMHFEAGGTLLDFDARAMRSHFRREFADAKQQLDPHQAKA